MRTPTMAAFTAPSWGFSWNRPRKMTPAASIEMAIGMKMISRNAVFHLSFSSSTAKISPRTVHSSGATSTHRMLLRMAVNVVSLVNIAT
ncbi:hypothetical protein [Tessaracoccus coleopterorum]|uniref:hypothetical protein n=1 Tax=Tessaracoccus coleopterorum TaxID=2714950 RepID=UPI0018D4B1E9|nr:hypothetical protein [Tessaracoccus coleopterorum]